MIVYIVLLLVTTAAAALVVKPEILPVRGMNRQMFQNRLSLCAIFLLLSAVSAARYYVGNDYGRYEDHFYNIWNGYVVPTERGFNVLVKCLQTLFGEENYLFLFAFFAFVTVFFTLKALYTLSTSFVFSFYLFMAFGYYYQSLNTVRYYVAAAFALCAIPHLFRKNYGKFVLTVLLGALIHKSALVVLPVYFLANCRWKRWQTALLSVLAVSGLVFGDFYLKVILYLYPTYRDTIYLEGGTSYANIARCILVLLFCLSIYRDTMQDNKQLLFYFRLNVAALMLYLCGSFIPEVSRIGTYLTVTQVFLLPGAALRIPDKRKRTAAVIGITVFGAVYFAAFLYKAYGELVKLLPYRTWLF